MRFENPAALWGLSSLILLILFSLWRQASAKVTVPSLLLWKRIPERNPPVRALRRPRWRLELLLQALAIGAAVIALAKPYRLAEEYKPRRVALVFDTSARMRAGDRLAAMKTRAGQIIRDDLSADAVTLYAAVPAPRRIDRLDELRYVDAHVDLSPLIQAAKGAAEHVIVFSDAAVDGTHPILFGAPADNAGIVAFSVSDTDAFVRIDAQGAPRPRQIELRSGDTRVEATLPAGQQTWSHRADYSTTPLVRVSILTEDALPLDNAVAATRLATGGGLVTLTGRHHDSLVRVFKAIPGLSVLRGTAPALVAVGFDEAPGPGDLRVQIHSADAALSGEVVVAEHPLMHDLGKRGREWERILGELPPASRAGQALIRVGGKVAAAVKGNDVHVCVDLHSWQGLPSFPIFWVNAVDVAQKTARGLTIIRSGQAVQLPPNSALTGEPQGALRELRPDGLFVAHTVGEYRLAPVGDGYKQLVVNLLDERESRWGTESRGLTWTPGAASVREPRRHDLGGAAAWSALAFLLLAWLLQLRPE